MKSNNCPICKHEFFFPVQILGLVQGGGGQHGDCGLGTGALSVLAGRYRELEHCGKCGFIRLKEIK